MEFKFRPSDHRPPSQPPPPPRQYASPLPPGVYCVSKQGFTDPCLRRNVMRKPFDIKEAMHCEIELMRLREEKLLVEVERQRFLKEEARRELILAEREMAIRGAAQAAGYSFREQRWGTSFSAAAPVVQSHEWQHMEQLKSSDRRGFRAVAVPLLPPPPPPRLPPFTADDSKQQRQLQVQAEKSELIVLEKPDPEQFRKKQKAVAPLVLDIEVRPLGVKKRSKDEWSCALCRVTVSSERTFDQHLQGKKHQRNEAGLRAQKVCNVSQAAPALVPKKRRRTSGCAGAEEKELKVGDSPQCERTGNKKFQFWCKMCKVGAHATEVMEAHLNGKKHKASLREICQSRTEQPL